MRLKRLPRLVLSLLLFTCFLANFSSAEEVEVSESARRHFKAGVAFLQDPDGARYEEAYREFKAAYSDSPSWKILGNLGIAAMKLERDGEAIDAIKNYLTHAGESLTPEERAQFERDLSSLEASVVQLTIKVAPAGAMLTDEREPVQGSPITNRYGPITDQLVVRVRPGHHRLTVRLDGYEEQVWVLDAPSGSKHLKEFQLEPPPPAATAAPATTVGTDSSPATERPIPTSVYVGGGVTALLAVGAGVTGFLASAKKSDFDDANDGNSPEEARGLQDDTKSLNLMADLMLVGAAAAGGITAYFYFTRPEVPQTKAITVTPILARNAGAITVTGSF